MSIIHSHLLPQSAGGGGGADFLQRLKDDLFTSVWKMDEASGNAVDTQGVVNAVVAAGVTRSVTSIIPNKPSDDAMTFDSGTDTVIAPSVATYDNMFDNDVIFLFTIEITSNANECLLLGKFGGTAGGFVEYRATSQSPARTITMLVRYTGADLSVNSTTDAVALDTPSLVEVHYDASSPTSSKVYVNGSDVTNGTPAAPDGTAQSDNSTSIDIFSGFGTALAATGQYAAIKLGTGNATDAADRYTSWNTAP